MNLGGDGMNFDSLNKMIEYIEENLDSEIDFNELILINLFLNEFLCF